MPRDGKALLIIYSRKRHSKGGTQPRLRRGSTCGLRALARPRVRGAAAERGPAPPPRVPPCAASKPARPQTARELYLQLFVPAAA